MKKFSVLISVYAKENQDFFDDALRSIYAQSLKPDEVVICIDGPVGDGIESVLKKYSKEYPKQTKLLYFKENRGLGKTLADGILACSNEVIFRMDSDDISNKDRFKKQYEIIKDGKYDVVGSNIAEYDEMMRKCTGDRVVPERQEDIVTFSKHRNPVNHMSACYLKSSVIAAGNYKDMPGFEDYYLWLRMLKNGAKMYNIQENLINARCGKKMTEKRGGKTYVENIMRFEKEILREGIISKKEYYENVAIRTITASMPNAIRSSVYNLKLRSKK